MSHSVARRCWSPFSADGRAVAFAHADDLNRKRNGADKTAGANQGDGHAGRNLHAPTGSGSASGQGSGQQLAVRPDHTAVCEGVLDSRTAASKENAPTRHARATGRDLSSTPVGRLAQMTN